MTSIGRPCAGKLLDAESVADPPVVAPPTRMVAAQLTENYGVAGSARIRDPGCSAMTW